MRHQRDLRKQLAIRPPNVVAADPVKKARIISDTLPSVIREADAAGLSIISQYLSKALVLAERVAAAGENRKISG